jgi:hypothetical protein
MIITNTTDTVNMETTERIYFSPPWDMNTKKCKT